MSTDSFHRTSKRTGRPEEGDKLPTNDVDQRQSDSVAAPELSPYTDGTPEDRAAWVKLFNLQRRILPQTAPSVPGYRLELAYRPAFVVTGDYHDFFHRPDGTAIFVGDGSGHGPAASMLMAIMRTILQTHDIHSDPGRTLTIGGKMFYRLIPSDLFMTGVYLLLQDNGEVTWAAGGHHPPLWIQRTGHAASIDDHLSAVGPVLGISPKAEYATLAWKLAPGDRLFLFTDGLWEARNSVGQKYGRARLRKYLLAMCNVPLEEALRRLVADTAEHLAGTEFEDDFTVVGIEREL